MPTDILDDTNGDIDFTNGDISYGESTKQHQRDILFARKGDYKSAPAVGVGIEDYVKDENPQDMLPEIRRQYTKDGQTVNKLQLSADGKLNINANY